MLIVIEKWKKMKKKKKKKKKKKSAIAQILGGKSGDQQPHKLSIMG
jgi:hypothetical protein